MNITDLLSSSNFLTVNKSLIKLFGLKEAVLLGELCAEYNYWEEQDKLENGWFYSTVENIEQNTGLSTHEQRQALKYFEEIGLISIEKRGMPAKRYIYMDISQLCKICTTSDSNFEQQVVQNLHLNNNNILLSNKLDNNTKNNNKKSEILGNPKIHESKTQTSLFSTSKKTNKKKIYNDCVDLIHNKFKDEDVKEKLIQYLSIRIKKGLTVEQWNEILEELKCLASTKEKALEIIQNAYLSNWMKFFPISSSRTKAYEENFKVAEQKIMSNEDKIKILEQNIVRDESGNIKIY